MPIDNFAGNDFAETTIIEIVNFCSGPSIEFTSEPPDTTIYFDQVPATITLAVNVPN